MSGLHESEIWAINIDINCPHSGEVPSYLYISLLTFLKFYHQIKNKYALYVNVSVDSEAKCKICVDKSLLMFWHLWSELSSFTNRLFNILVVIKALKKNRLWQFMGQRMYDIKLYIITTFWSRVFTPAPVCCVLANQLIVLKWWFRLKEDSLHDGRWWMRGQTLHKNVFVPILLQFTLILSWLVRGGRPRARHGKN